MSVEAAHNESWAADGADAEGVAALSGGAVALACLYALVLAVGLLGNALIACALLRQRATRNLLLLNLCASDLLVCGLSGPVSVVIALRPRVSMALVACKAVFFLQGVPVAASTLSLMMLSVDRYASIEHPHLLSQMRQSRRLPVLMNMFVWLVALLASCPILYSRTTTLPGAVCEEVWPTYSLRVSFTLCQVAVVYVVPGLTVAACHHVVGHKLYAVSLVAAAANGDIPLPMPILGRQKEVIIVASLQPDLPSKTMQRHNKEGDGDEADDRRKRSTSRHKSLKSSESGRSKPPLTKQMSRQSLNSRRRLANMLVALVVVFATCWLPYVVLKIYSVDPSADDALIQSLLPFCLLLGHTHSAINPIVYWFLNRQSVNLTAACCGPLWTRNGSHSGSKGNFRFLAAHKDRDRRPSSTNEAALGIFHPRYTVPKPRPRTQPRESSQFYV
ncbi:cholecystokinin receptor isoform X1 [Nilaparvata lugens]|uniref:cholecystokinin receptor isoform X1 n=1 Tax=Nilaparvata lugens TaxID=108931 RepID=UPI00193EAF64|nr:cholecystokinin receptor isoform X1 [Nilaparvata lugens]XP_039277197.1 cholecystokinin receptor isoform X1 [Nilaparvata lugens]